MGSERRDEAYKYEDVKLKLDRECKRNLVKVFEERSNVS